MQIDNLVAVSWHHDMLPDFLWIALMLGRRSDWRAVYRPLDIVDQFVPDGPRFVDGRLTTFALVPEGRRAEVRDLIRRETPHALPAALGHAQRTPASEGSAVLGQQDPAEGHISSRPAPR
jgi:hypothetical protein